jgi:hypothetical protein
MLDRNFREFAKLATPNSGTKSVEDASYVPVVTFANQRVLLTHLSSVSNCFSR